MTSLVIGVSACTAREEGRLAWRAPAQYGEAAMRVFGGLSVLIPPVGPAAVGLLDRIDGLLLSGSPSNVAPSLYGETEDLTPRHHDAARDGTTLPLLRAAIDRGMPLLAICRGHQELNVAFGGSLHQQVHDVTGRGDHRAGDGPLAKIWGDKHEVTLSGTMARLFGAPRITVNSLHEQAIDRLGEGLVAEAVAEDGTIEGVRVEAARAFAYGVQWHPEWEAWNSPVGTALFEAFGAACGAYAMGRTAAPLRARRA